MRRNGFFRIARVELAMPSITAAVMGLLDPDEIGFSMCERSDGSLTHGPVARGTPTSVSIPVSCPPGTVFVGLGHTHPRGVAFPSQQDIRSARQTGARNLCIRSDDRTACFQVSGV